MAAKFTYNPLRIFGYNSVTGGARTDGNQTRGTRWRELTVKGQHSPKFSSSPSEGRGMDELVVPWPQAIRQGAGSSPFRELDMDFLGYSEEAKYNNTIAGIRRVIPYPHPSRPNYLYARAVQNLEGWVPEDQDATTKIAIYDEAKVSLLFEAPPYDIGDTGATGILIDGAVDEADLKQYVSIATDTVGRSQGVPAAAALRWDLPDLQGIANQPFTNVATVYVLEGEVQITWYQVPVEAVPHDAISRCVNCSDGPNAAGRYMFLSDSYRGPVFQTRAGRARSNFICLQPSFGKPYRMANEKWAIDITYKFKFKPFGSNYWYRWQTGSFEPASQVAVQTLADTAIIGLTAGALGPLGVGLPLAQNRFYPERNFRQLFWGAAA